MTLKDKLRMYATISIIEQTTKYNMFSSGDLKDLYDSGIKIAYQSDQYREHLEHIRLELVLRQNQERRRKIQVWIDTKN